MQKNLVSQAKGVATRAITNARAGITNLKTLPCGAIAGAMGDCHFKRKP